MRAVLHNTRRGSAIILKKICVTGCEHCRVGWASSIALLPLPQEHNLIYSSAVLKTMTLRSKVLYIVFVWDKIFKHVEAFDVI